MERKIEVERWKKDEMENIRISKFREEEKKRNKERKTDKIDKLQGFWRKWRKEGMEKPAEDLDNDHEIQGLDLTPRIDPTKLNFVKTKKLKISKLKDGAKKKLENLEEEVFK